MEPATAAWSEGLDAFERRLAECRALLERSQRSEDPSGDPPEPATLEAWPTAELLMAGPLPEALAPRAERLLDESRRLEAAIRAERDALPAPRARSYAQGRRTTPGPSRFSRTA